MIDTIIQALKEEAKSQKEKPNDERLKQAIKDLQNEKVSSTEEFILQHYNLCILMTALSEQSMQRLFEDHLSSLNEFLAFNNRTYQPKSIKIFDKVADLNFKAHRYKDAITCLEKAILLEGSLESDRGETLFKRKFRRRWLLATCLEYSGLSTLETFDMGLNTQMEPSAIETHDLEIMTAVQLLVGDKVLSYYRQDDKQNAVKEDDQHIVHYNREEIIHAIESLKDDHQPILSIASPSEKKFQFPNINISEKCLARQVEQWKEYLSNELYEKMLNDIAHIAAHCLSELEKHTPIKDRKLYQFQNLRFSEILMRNLGENYITCLATIAIERGEYYIAEDILKRRRLAILNAVEAKLLQNNSSHSSYLDCAYSDVSSSFYGNDNFIKMAEQLALIDFYLWYFSVIADKKDHEINKNAFKEYCEKSNDSTAQTYYSVVEFKEFLIKGFNLISSDTLSIGSPRFQTFLQEVDGAYTRFNKHKPISFIHNSIQDEWIFLNKAHAVFSLCCSAFSNPREIDFFAYKIIKLLEEPLVGSIKENIKLEDTRFYLIKSPSGSFIYKGDDRAIKELGKMHSICFSLIPKSINPGDHLYKPPYVYYSNILVIITDNTINDDIHFIEEILRMEREQNLSDNERHSFFIDYSELSDTKKSEFMEDRLNIFNNKNFYLLSSKDGACKAFTLCVLFSRIEKMLYSLHKPMNSYMISPISNDIAYKEQYEDEPSLLLSLMDTKDDLKADETPFNLSDKVFSACLPSIKTDSFVGLSLNLEQLTGLIHNISMIKHLFVVSIPSGERFQVNYFDLYSHYNMSERYINSDTIYINDPERDMLIALDNILTSNSEKPFCKNNYQCEAQVCISCITCVEQIRKQKGTTALCDYLLYYVGVVLEKNMILLVQNRRAEEPHRYLLFVLDSFFSKDDDKVCSYCKAFKQTNNLIISTKESDFRVQHDSLSRVTELKEQIQPLDKSKKFVFISYRAKKGLPKLCEPVYRDVIYLQNTYKQIGFFIDIKNLEDTPDMEIERIIKDTNCVGALIYLSPDYFFRYEEGKIIPASEDACLKEAELLLGKGEDCFIYPIFLSETLTGSLFEGNLKAEEFVQKTLIKFQEVHDRERLDTYYKLFKCQDHLFFPKRTILTHDLSENHFKRTQEGDNFINTIIDLLNNIENEK